MRGLFLGMDLKYLTRRVVMASLLQKSFFVRDRVSLDQILKLWEVRRAQESPYHGDLSFKEQRRETKSANTRAGLPGAWRALMKFAKSKKVTLSPDLIPGL